MQVERQTPLDRFMAALAASDLSEADSDERMEALAQELAPSAERTLLPFLAASDIDQRWWTVRALALIGSGQAAPPLAGRLDDDDAGVRAAACLALGSLHRRAPDAAAPWLPALALRLTDEEGFVRQAATDALAQCGDAAVPALARVLAESHDGARTRATIALRKIGTLRAAGVLFQLLNDANYLVRAYAYEALDEMGFLEQVYFKP